MAWFKRISLMASHAGSESLSGQSRVWVPNIPHLRLGRTVRANPEDLSQKCTRQTLVIGFFLLNASVTWRLHKCQFKTVTAFVIMIRHFCPHNGLLPRIWDWRCEGWLEQHHLYAPLRRPGFGPQSGSSILTGFSIIGWLHCPSIDGSWRLFIAMANSMWQIVLRMGASTYGSNCVLFHYLCFRLSYFALFQRRNISGINDFVNYSLTTWSVP